jgi:hypothetical protein
MPGMPGMNPNAGMSEQEQQMIKFVGHPTSCAASTFTYNEIDASKHGVLRRQDSNGRRHGRRLRSHVRSLHGIGTRPSYNSPRARPRGHKD